jgi:hypothetical protein
MPSVEDTITGLIEFDVDVARQTMLVRCASDESLQSTLANLALDELYDVDSDEESWDEVQLLADVDALEQELLLLYRRVQRRLTE